MHHSEMYRLLEKKCMGADCILCKIADGQYAGAAILIADNKILWSDGTNSPLPGMISELSSVSSTSLVDMDGIPVFAERVGSCPRLIICGGGHVASALVSTMQPLEFELWLLEDREEFAATAREKGVAHVLCGAYEESLKQIPVSPDNYFVVMTRGHQYDELCLKTILTMPAYAYAGLMASKVRGQAMLNTLLSLGIAQDAVDMVHTPIGLKIGAQTPQEIAISVAAELIGEKARLGKSKWMPDELFRQLTVPDCEKVLCTIIAKRGSAPRAAGTKMLVPASGPVLGTIGGGRTEADIIAAARDMLSDPAAHTRRITAVMNAEECIDQGLGCGGLIDVLLEKLN